MRTFGLLLLAGGIAGYFYCTTQGAKLEPVPEGATMSLAWQYPAGKMEVGRYAAGCAALVGVLFMMFPQGR